MSSVNEEQICTPPPHHQAFPATNYNLTENILVKQKDHDHHESKLFTYGRAIGEFNDTFLFNGKKLAPCQFHPRFSKMLTHFPHIMEHLYPCFDYWMSNPAAQPILIFNEEQQKFWQIGQTKPFMEGLLKVLDLHLGVQQMLLLDYQQAYSASHPVIFARVPSLGYVFRHSQEWNDMIESYMLNTKAAATTTQQSSCQRLPRIRILNRKKSRSIENAPQLAKQLSTVDFYGNHATTANSKQQTANSKQQTTNSTTTNKVTVHFFEEANFMEQVRFFQTTDILISGHGAQLTGVPWMANKPCSQLLELHPHNHAIPFYFGSLATLSGVSFSYMYLGNDGNTTVVMPWENLSDKTHLERKQARLGNLCPAPNVMVAAMTELIKDWYMCCQGVLTENTEQLTRVDME